MSRTWTSCPSSAKQAAVTSPTQPAPMTPIGSRSGIGGGELPERPRGVRDRQHLALGQRLRQRVADPVDRVVGLPGDDPRVGAVAVDPEDAIADLLDLARAAEDRRVLPAESLEADVLADLPCRDHEPVRLVA